MKTKIDLTLMSDAEFRIWCKSHRKENECGVCQTEDICWTCHRKAQLEFDQSNLGVNR